MGEQRRARRGLRDDRNSGEEGAGGLLAEPPCREVEGVHVPGDAWSPHLEGSKDLIADWVTLKCGNYNKVSKKCGGST